VPYDTILRQEPPPGTKLPRGATVHAIASAGPPPVVIPTVLDKSCASAVAILRHVAFTASCPPARSGYSSSIARGLAMGVFAGNAANPSTAFYGSALIVQLSKGPPPAPLPNVVGAPGLQALATLRQPGYVPEVVHVFSRSVHAGNVIGTTPLPGAMVQPGKPVRVVISNGAPTTVPSLGGADLAKAEQILVGHGLTVVATHGSPKSKTWVTQPPAGTVVAVGTPVTLYGR